MTSYDVTFVCKSKNSVEKAKSERGAAIKCPACGLDMAYIHDQHKLGANGLNEKTLGHELRKVVEL